MSEIQEPRPGNEYRAKMRRTRNARRRDPGPFVSPRQTWGKRPFTYARECARRLRQRESGDAR